VLHLRRGAIVGPRDLSGTPEWAKAIVAPPSRAERLRIAADRTGATLRSGRTNPTMAERTIRITRAASRPRALNGSKTASAVWDALPLDIPRRDLGDGSTSASGEGQGGRPREVVDLAIWPTGPRAPRFCIFFGPHRPAGADEIRPASAVNVVFRVVCWVIPPCSSRCAPGTKVASSAPDRGRTDEESFWIARTWPS